METQNTHFPTLVAGAIFSLLLTGGSVGQITATSDPVGYTTATVRGKTGASNPNSFFSIGLTRTESWRGTANDVFVNGEGRTILATGNIFPPSSLIQGDAGEAHYLQILDGPNAGAISNIIANNSDTITLADDLGEVLLANETMFRIVPHWTMGTAFPGGGGLSGANSPTLADIVTIYPPAGAPSTLFYNTTAGQWRRGLSDATHYTIPPGSGVMVTRKQSGDVQISFLGSVATTPVEVQVGGGASPGALTLVSNPHPINSLTLAQSGLYTGNLATGVAGGSSPTAADTVTIYNPQTGTGVNYFYNTTAGQWRQGLSNASEVTIPEGAAVLINRKNSRAPFSWYASPPSMGLD